MIYSRGLPPDQETQSLTDTQKGYSMEEMTVMEMQRFLNQQCAEGKTELEAYRNLMAILGLTYPAKTDN